MKCSSARKSMHKTEDEDEESFTDVQTVGQLVRYRYFHQGWPAWRALRGIHRHLAQAYYQVKRELEEVVAEHECDFPTQISTMQRICQMRQHVAILWLTYLEFLHQLDSSSTTTLIQEILDYLHDHCPMVGNHAYIVLARWRWQVVHGSSLSLGKDCVSRCLTAAPSVQELEAYSRNPIQQQRRRVDGNDHNPSWLQRLSQVLMHSPILPESLLPRKDPPPKICTLEQAKHRIALKRPRNKKQQAKKVVTGLRKCRVAVPRRRPLPRPVRIRGGGPPTSKLATDRLALLNRVNQQYYQQEQEQQQQKKDEDSPPPIHPPTSFHYPYPYAQHRPYSVATTPSWTHYPYGYIQGSPPQHYPPPPSAAYQHHHQQSGPYQPPPKRSPSATSNAASYRPYPSQYGPPPPGPYAYPPPGAPSYRYYPPSKDAPPPPKTSPPTTHPRSCPSLYGGSYYSYPTTATPRGHQPPLVTPPPEDDDDTMQPMTVNHVETSKNSIVIVPSQIPLVKPEDGGLVSNVVYQAFARMVHCHKSSTQTGFCCSHCPNKFSLFFTSESALSHVRVVRAVMKHVYEECPKAIARKRPEESPTKGKKKKNRALFFANLWQRLQDYRPNQDPGLMEGVVDQVQQLQETVNQTNRPYLVGDRECQHLVEQEMAWFDQALFGTSSGDENGDDVLHDFDIFARSSLAKEDLAFFDTSLKADSAMTE